MSNQLFTVDVAAQDGTLIPVTEAEFETDLVHPVTRVYVYVGQELDRGWRIAKSVAGEMSDLHPYLALSIDVMRKWVPDGDPDGIVFGTDHEPDRLLDAGEVVISKIVRLANEVAK